VKHAFALIRQSVVARFSGKYGRYAFMVREIYGATATTSPKILDHHKVRFQEFILNIDDGLAVR
jgi:hypothetical protein